MEHVDFSEISLILGHFEKFSEEFVKLNQKEYSNYLEEWKSFIYCSKKCAESSNDNREIHILSRSVNSFPIDNLFLVCKCCSKKILPNDEIFILSTKGVLDKKLLYETIFVKYFLIALIFNTIDKYVTLGIFYYGERQKEILRVWIKQVLKELKVKIPANKIFFRVKKIYKYDSSIYGKDYLRKPSIEYLDSTRFARSGIFNLYLSEDIETGKKEIRLKSGEEYIFAKFTTKREIEAVDLTVLNEPNNFKLLFEKAYDNFALKYGQNEQVFILIKSAFECMKCLFVPYVNQKANDSFKFKIEYIIPQVLSDLIKTLFIDSILYNSTQNNGKKCLVILLPPDEIDNLFEQNKTEKGN